MLSTKSNGKTSLRAKGILVYIFIECLLAKCKIWFSARLADSLESHCFDTHHSKSIRSWLMHSTCYTFYRNFPTRTYAIWIFDSINIFAFTQKQFPPYSWLIDGLHLFFIWLFFTAICLFAAHTVYLVWIGECSPFGCSKGRAECSTAQYTVHGHTSDENILDFCPFTPKNTYVIVCHVTCKPKYIHRNQMMTGEGQEKENNLSTMSKSMMLLVVLFRFHHHFTHLWENAI